MGVIVRRLEKRQSAKDQPGSADIRPDNTSEMPGST
jgi:hypothetical protein